MGGRWPPKKAHPRIKGEFFRPLFNVLRGRLGPVFGICGESPPRLRHSRRKPQAGAVERDRARGRQIGRQARVRRDLVQLLVVEWPRIDVDDDGVSVPTI